MEYCVLEISIKSLSNVYISSAFSIFLTVAEIVFYGCSGQSLPRPQQIILFLVLNHITWCSVYKKIKLISHEWLFLYKRKITCFVYEGRDWTQGREQPRQRSPIDLQSQSTHCLFVVYFFFRQASNKRLKLEHWTG